MTDDKKIDDKKIDDAQVTKILRDFADRGARDRRERIATALLAGGVAHPESAGGVDCVKWAINLADKLIQELDKEDGR